MKTIKRSMLHFMSGMLAGIFILMQLSFNESTGTERERNKNQSEVRQWYAPEVPEKMSFAGEAVPLDKWEVKERFDRELLYNYYYQNNIFYLLKLANRYFPAIEARLKANGIPDDFKYLCVAESNLLANATSKAGAVGFWQFLSGTAPGYDLEVNDNVDLRRDLERSTDAASEYLKQAYQKFGTWTAAAASYNCGMGGYNSQATFQKTKYYYDLLLPEETNRYIFRILAFKHLMENAESLGFVLEDDQLYHPVKTREVIVTSTVADLAQFAIDNGTTYKMLRVMNPWIKGKSLRVKAGKSYVIKLPG